MKPTFTTRDRVTFDTEEKAKKHEKILDEIERITRTILPKKLDTNAFANGHGYIQLSSDQVDTFEEAAVKLLKLKDEGLYSGILGRKLCDKDSPLYTLWLLAQQLDRGTLRLWGQPYYALHPEEGDDIQLNKRIK